MIQPPEIATLTDFARNAPEAIERLKETGQPQVLTVDGRAEAVVLDIASYERFLELADRAEAVAAIRQALEEAARGEGRPAREVYEEFRAEFGLSHAP